MSTDEEHEARTDDNCHEPLGFDRSKEVHLSAQQFDREGSQMTPLESSHETNIIHLPFSRPVQSQCIDSEQPPTRRNQFHQHNTTGSQMRWSVFNGSFISPPKYVFIDKTDAEVKYLKRLLSDPHIQDHGEWAACDG
jgi:hypothetical protein